jgi:hypothetical protein
MNGLFASSTLNPIKQTVTTGAAALCAINSKYFIDKGLELVADPTPLIEARDSIVNIWSATKDFFKSIEPYQPLAAGVTIISKAIWKTKTRGQLNRDIKTRANTLAILKDLKKKKGIDCSNRIGELRQELQSKKDDRIHSVLSVAQLGSLFFSHPGSNVWNFANTLYGRLFSLRHTNLANRPITAALGAISALGTVTSLLKVTGTITGAHPLSHLIIGASFVGMAIESGLMVKNWLFKR